MPKSNKPRPAALPPQPFLNEKFVMPTSLKIAEVVHHVSMLYQHVKKPDMAFRRFDGQTSCLVHSIGAGLSILQEPKLNPNLRILGFYSLAYHDVFEESMVLRKSLRAYFRTNYSCCAEYLIQYVTAMTFGNFRSECRYLWARAEKLPALLLYKAYDKANNWKDPTWLAERPFSELERHVNHSQRIAESIACNYGELSVVSEIAYATAREQLTRKDNPAYVQMVEVALSEGCHKT